MYNDDILINYIFDKHKTKENPRLSQGQSGVISNLLIRSGYKPINPTYAFYQ